jgi:TM2 domain-containing membrane protein YozV
MMSQLPIGIKAGGASLSNDTRTLILFEANKKHELVALWLCLALGLLGAHNFYLKRTGVAIAQLILTLTIIGFFVTIVWVIVDIFLVTGWVRERNNWLAAELGA